MWKNNLMAQVKINKSEHDERELNENYTTILHLARRLEYEGIPYDLHRLYDGWKILFGGDYGPDIVQHGGSYGAGAGFMESYGFDEDNGDVTGYLTLADAVKMIYHYYGIEKEE